ncbi:MAG: tetratricopeptide repeat protein [Bradymonadia bacterium]
MVRWQQIVVTYCVVMAALGCSEPEAPKLVEGTVYVVPIGHVPRAEVERAAKALTMETGRPARILNRQPLPHSTRSEVGQYPVWPLLDQLLDTAPVDTFRILGVTDVDLSAPGYRYVIGYARHSERALVYSTARVPQEISETTRRRWIQRIVAHELGHTYGADHCSKHCIMRTTRTVHDIEYLPNAYCPEHQLVVDAGRKLNPGDPTALAQMAREYVRLGRWSEATKTYKSSLLAEPEQPRLYVELGISLMAQGRLKNAVRAFEAATRMEPEAPQAYYALAVLFAAGYAPWRAPAYLEAAVRRDLNPKRAHRAAGILYTDLLHDEEAATRHFEHYIQKGGRDADVIARLVYMVSPTVITIEQPETIVAQWEPGRGLKVAALDLDEGAPVDDVEHTPSEESACHHDHGASTHGAGLAVGVPDTMPEFGVQLSAALEAARAGGHLN